MSYVVVIVFHLLFVVVRLVKPFDTQSGLGMAFSKTRAEGIPWTETLSSDELEIISVLLSFQKITRTNPIVLFVY